MTSKRSRDEDHYRSKEEDYRSSTRRKYERSHHESYERSHNKEFERNRNYERNPERSQERTYHYERINRRESNYDRTSQRESNRERNLDRNFERNVRNHDKNTDRKCEIKSERLSIEPPSNDKATSTNSQPIVKEKVNFNKSGKLAQDTNMQNGVIVKYSEPFEAGKPNQNWRLYPFKNEESLPFIPIHRKSHYLLGRDRKVVDIPLDHPSVSKQHAVIQFRQVELERNNGSKHKQIRPYLMDLESSNKTYLNNNEIDPLKYYQLLEKDMIKFGFSSREYVVLIDHEND